MGASDERKSCVKCLKAIKSTEKFLVCGLWCRKSFHNDCVGLSNSETRVVAYSKERIKFHCENCENRLGIEVVGEKETHEPNKLQNCVNLLELVQKILKLSNELSNHNSVINKKLDTVISSNTRLEEYILQSPKCIEKRIEETMPIDNSVECVESFSEKRTIQISEENDTNSDVPTVNSVSMGQQTDDISSTLHIASVVPEELLDNQEAHVAEECSSNCTQEWEKPDGQDSTQDGPTFVKEECSPPEDFLTCGTFSIGEIENAEVEEISSVMELEGEKYSSSDDFLQPCTLSTEMTKSEEEIVNEINFEELKDEVESTVASGEAGSSTPVSVEVYKINEDSRGGRNLQHKTDKCKKTCEHMHDMQECIQVDRFEPAVSCKLCHKTFVSISKLKGHIRLHNVERPYSCSVCGKSFSYDSNFARHIRVHTGKRPYSCRF